MPDATSRSPGDDSKYLLHSDKSWIQVSMYCPTIETFTLAQGFSQEHLKALQGAVTQVVEANPILMGKVTLENECLYLTPNAYPLDEHVFFEKMDLSDQVSNSFNFSDNNHKENIQFMTDKIFPLVKHQRGTGNTEVKKKSALFSFTLFVLTESIICYKMSLSHLIGDASTYYCLVDQMNSALKKEPLQLINWDNPLAKTCGILPDQSSERDRYRMAGAPMLISVLRNLPSLPFRKANHFFLDQQGIDEKKLSLVNKNQHDFLSTNDIVMSALCRMNRTSKVTSMVINRRGRTNGVEDRDGGIFIFSPILESEAGKDPNVIRQFVKDGGYFEPDQVPLQPYLQGKVCCVTNWATLTKFISIEGVKTLCHMPSPAFFEAPLDGSVIFKVNDGCTAVCCNFPVHNVKGDSFLRDIISHDEEDKNEAGLNEVSGNDEKKSWVGGHPKINNIALASALTLAGAVAVQCALGSSRQFRR